MPATSAAPDRIDLQNLPEPLYLGSVQTLYPIPDHPAWLLCETTEAGSVFDVGSIFHIEGSDLNRALFRHAAYTRLSHPATWEAVKAKIDGDAAIPPDWKAELLSGPMDAMLESGASTHHLGMVDAATHEVITTGLPKTPSAFNIVRRFPVLTPPLRTVLGNHVFDYAQFHQSDTYVIPLEYIVRFGITSGSSIYKHYLSMSGSERRSYEEELGLSGPMEPWKMLGQPIFDLTSKYEPQDRNVSKQEALLMSGLSAAMFSDTIKMALLGGWAIRERLEAIGLQLWDLKWEFAVDHDTLLFVDTIDSDSFRATGTMEVDGRRVVVHYNKQAMRDYYKILHPEWFAGINQAKTDARSAGQPFKPFLQAGQAAGAYPPTPNVEAEFLDIQSRKSALIRDFITDTAAADTVKSGLEALGREEVQFYTQHQRLNELLALNALD